MITDIIAGILSGILGAMGFGGGGILILYLTFYKDMPQLTAQGINLIFFIPSAILAIIIHTKNKLIEWKIAVKYMLLGFAGLGLGYLILNALNEQTIRKIFSIILIFVGLKELFFSPKNNHR
jgi:uncharacterized membrane protein YfcA